MAVGSPRSNAPDRPAGIPMAPGVPLVAGARLPLAFIGCGLAGLTVGAAWLAIKPAALLLPHMHPHVVALAHVWLPGFLLSACIGAMYQLMPVVLGTALRGGRGVWVHFALHLTGVALLVGGLAAGRFEFAALGGAFVSAGVILLTQCVLRTFAASGRRDVASRCFPLAATWLAVTVLAGVTLAVLRRWPVLPFSPLGLLRAHAHLGFVGFFLTLLQGTTFQLVPMFTMADARKLRAAGAGLAATQAGLLVLAFGLGGEWPPVSAIGAVLIAAGIALSGIAFVATIATRRRRQMEPGIRAFVIGATLLGASTLAGLVLLAMPAGSLTVAGAMSYGIVVVVGALSLAIMGMLAKIIPFLVWMRTYGPRIGRTPVPSATSLPSRPLERTWLALHLTALPLLAAAPLAESQLLAAIGAWLLALGVVSFLANAIRIAAHTWWPQAGAAPAIPPLSPAAAAVARRINENTSTPVLSSRPN